jgi:hypothetical protein
MHSLPSLSASRSGSVYRGCQQSPHQVPLLCSLGASVRSQHSIYIHLDNWDSGLPSPYVTRTTFIFYNERWRRNPILRNACPSHSRKSCKSRSIPYKTLDLYLFTGFWKVYSSSAIGATAQAAAMVQASLIACGICGRQTGTRVGFPRVLRFHLTNIRPIPRNHHPQSGPGTIGQRLTEVPCELYLTPPHEKTVVLLQNLLKVK